MSRRLDRELDPDLFLRSDRLIRTWTQKYLNDECEVWDLEEGVWRALTGCSDAATVADAEAIAASRSHEDEWFMLAHEAKMKRWARS